MILKADGLSLGYGRDYVVEDIHFHIKKGEVVTLIGANGCGKSTVLRAVSRNLKPGGGVVYLDGESISKLNSKEVARRMAILPQAPKVPDDFTVRDLVSYGRFPHLNWTGRMGPEDYQVVEWAIEVTRIGGLQHRLVSTLSGGERQRAWIAVALAQQPEILLLDEPTTFLDICYQMEVLELIATLNKQLNLTILMVLHDLNQAARYSHRIIILKDGRLYREGRPIEVITPEVLAEVFHIQVKIFTDHDHQCPYFIPLGSLRGEKDEGCPKSRWDEGPLVLSWTGRKTEGGKG